MGVHWRRLSPERELSLSEICSLLNSSYFVFPESENKGNYRAGGASDTPQAPGPPFCMVVEKDRAKC